MKPDHPAPYFLQELQEQSTTVRASLLATTNAREALAERARSVNRIMLVGSGDSFFLGHAAVPAFEQLAGVPAETVEAYDFVSNRTTLLDVGTLVIGISASGKALYTLEAIERAERAGALTAAVVNNPGSPLTSKAGIALVTNVGLSFSFPTKTTTAALAALVGLAAEIGRVSRPPGLRAYHEHMHELNETNPSAIAACLNKQGVGDAARLLHQRRQLIFVGSGAARAAALIGAAKVCETCHHLALAINAEEYLHLLGFGVEPRDTVVVLALGPNTHREQQVAEYALRQGAQVLVARAAGDNVQWPATVVQLDLPIDSLAPWSRALVAMVLMHRLAGELSVLEHANPDRPEHVDLDYVLRLLYTTPLQGWL